MLKRLIALAVFLAALLSDSIFPQPENVEPNAVPEETTGAIPETPQTETPLNGSATVPPASSNPAVIIKRDPFEPVLRNMDLSEASFYTLEKYDIGQYTMIGIISGIPSPKVMFRAPDGRKYILKKGDRIGRNGGVITQIERKQIVVLERIKSYDGSVKENFVVLTTKNSS